MKRAKHRSATRLPRGEGRRRRRRPAHPDLARFLALSEAGARNAATALSQILGRPLRLAVPWARILPLNKVKEIAGGPSLVVGALSLRVYGEARGNLLVVFPREQLRTLLDMVVPRHWPAGRAREAGLLLGDMERSALMEIGNILACAYLNALSHLLGVSLLPSIPGLAIDMVGAVTDHILVEMAAESDTALVLACQVLEPESGLRGSIFFLPHAAALSLFARSTPLAATTGGRRRAAGK